MKIVNYSSLTYSEIVPFIVNLNIPFVSGSGTTLVVGPSSGNHITISWRYQYTTLTVNDGSGVNPWRCNDRQAIIVGYSDTILWFQLTDGSRRGVFLYEKVTDDLIVYGYNGTSWNQSHVFYNIEEVPCYDFDGLSYSHIKSLDYTDQAGYIDYTDNILFRGGYKHCVDPNFISCSAITSNQAITLRGRNYFTVGTNTLVEVDP